MSGDTVFGLQNLNAGGVEVLKSNKFFIQIGAQGSGVDSISIIAVGAPNLHNGGLLYDHIDDTLSLFVGSGMAMPIKVLTVNQAGDISIPGGIIFSGNLDMNGNNILNANDIETNSLTATGGTTITVNDDIDMTTHNLLNVGDTETNSITASNGSVITVNDDITMVGHDVNLNAININQGGGGGAVRIHSPADTTLNALTCPNSGNLLSTNDLTGSDISIRLPSYFNGFHNMTTAIVISNTNIYTVVQGFVGFNEVDFTHTALLATYTGTDPKRMVVNADISIIGTTATLASADIRVFVNPTINGANEVTASSEAIGFARVTFDNTLNAHMSLVGISANNIVNGDTVCFAIKNNVETANINFTGVNVLLQMQTVGLDTV